MRLAAPTPIEASHDLSQFECEHADLVDWLVRRALDNEASRASRTYVVCEKRVVVGYYALAAGSLAIRAAPGAIRRNMPDPIPVVVLGRLAVDLRHRGKGIGAGLLQDAVLRSVNGAQAIGARAMLCHAIDDSARSFYVAHGFRVSPIEPMTVMLDLGKVAALLR